MNLKALLLALSLLSVLVFPILPANAGMTVPNPNQYTYLTTGGAETCDPAWAYDTVSAELIMNVYQCLVDFDFVYYDRFVAEIADWWPGMGVNPGDVIQPLPPDPWQFDNATWVDLYNPICSMCESPSDVGITLTVYAPDWDPPSASTYIDHNTSLEVLIHQVVKSVGPAIDIITNKGPFPLGSTPNNNPIGVSDAFDPQEEICFYAKVTYNDDPVEYKPVDFEVTDPFGHQVDLTSFTNASGIATMYMRIPWTGPSTEALFGNWSTVASVDVAGTKVLDTVIWEFGYIISIRGIAVTGSPVYKGDTLTIDVDLQSISMVPHDVLLTVAACDKCGVPIGLTADFITVDAYDGWSAGHTIIIPSWAFVGTGTLYVNVFTDYPSAGGVPYCPEGTQIFTILKTL